MEQPSVMVSEERLRLLEKNVEDLGFLIEISSILASTLDLGELIALAMEKAKSFLEAEACSILLYNRETGKLEFELAICGEGGTSAALKKNVTLEMGQGIAGWVAQHLQPLVIEDVRNDPRFFRDADKLTGFTTQSIIAAPLQGRSGLIGVAEVINPHKKIYDKSMFQLLCRQFAMAIENAFAHKDSLERERLKQELEIAATLQKSFLPESPDYRYGDFAASAVNLCAEKVGGDLYDFIPLGGERVGVLIGDVSGKGVSAALYMARVSSEFKNAAHLEESPSGVLRRLNRSLARSPRGMFLTCIYLVVDAATGKVQLAAAGHPPFLRITRGEVQVVAPDAGPPLGIIEADYPLITLELERGDRLVLLTDGVFDAKDGKGARIGFEPLAAFVGQRKNEPRILDAVLEFVQAHAEGQKRADDLTLVELSWGLA